MIIATDPMYIYNFSVAFLLFSHREWHGAPLLLVVIPLLDLCDVET